MALGTRTCGCAVLMHTTGSALRDGLKKSSQCANSRDAGKGDGVGMIMRQVVRFCPALFAIIALRPFEAVAV
ncbi:hypothetical protein B0G76_5984 [Paraburkholderia sp. BL23I1N1]|nr:hypothetical protein B0G76_5984 [Paraburkholderia sp. BL23I1N1]